MGILRFTFFILDASEVYPCIFINSIGFGIQMHYHDLNEEFLVKYGTIDLHFGEEIKTAHAPQVLNIPKNQNHALFANNKHGFLLQETVDVDSFVKRSVVFV